MTNNSGEFSFENLPSGNNLYTLTPSKLTNYLNDVTAYDLSKINAHILGVELFQRQRVIAADANNSQSLTTYDIVALQNLILHNITTLPNGTPSWQFV
ncbi:MAG: hypothetical protein R2788_24325 [Saprospiraceae bacterium]